MTRKNYVIALTLTDGQTVEFKYQNVAKVRNVYAKIIEVQYKNPSTKIDTVELFQFYDGFYVRDGEMNE